jgi:N,N'-diacetyllegionaminate synthase
MTAINKLFSNEAVDPLIIAEVGQAHDGSLGTAHAFVEAAADAGADVIKFQTHIADEESSAQEPWRVKFSFQDDSRFDYWKRMEFTKEQWCGLKNHAEERGLIFLSSPFSVAAFRLLDEIGTTAWKVASGEITNLPLIKAMISTQKPILFSSGMANLNEIDDAVLMCAEANINFALFQCTTEYPSPPVHWGLDLIAHFKQKYNCPVGLSDHSGTIYAPLAAVALGANMIEVHVTLSKYSFGPDVQSSVTFNELKKIVEGSKLISKSLRSRVQKDLLSSEMDQSRKLFGHSLVAKAGIKKGEVLSEHNVCTRKPCLGIPVKEFYLSMGRKVNRDLSAKEFIQPGDIE